MSLCGSQHSARGQYSAHTPSLAAAKAAALALVCCCDEEAEGNATAEDGEAVVEGTEVTVEAVVVVDAVEAVEDGDGGSAKPSRVLAIPEPATVLTAYVRVSITRMR